MSIIANDSDVARGVAHLAAHCAVMNRIIPLVSDIPLRLRAPGFEGLAHIVVGQQVSTASANAIWTRANTVFSPLTPEAILAATDDQFIAAGLSRAKQRTLRAIAEAIRSGALPLDALGAQSAEQVRATLLSIKGIGPWTADVFAMFCLGHADAFAAGDLALQEAARLAFGRRARPDEKQMARLAQRWSPWRSVAARVLWAYYRIEKSREGVR